MRLSLSVLSLILLTSACRSGAGSSTSGFKAPPGDTTAIVAGVDTLGITKGQIEKILQPMYVQIAQQAQQSGQSIDAIAQPIRRQITAQLLLQEIMSLEAKRLKIVATPAQVDSLFNLVRSQYPDSNAFQEAMLKAGDTPESARLKFARQIVANKALEKALEDSLKISDATVDSFYQANKSRMGEAGKVKARHILKLAQDPADTAKAHAAIQAIAAQLAKGGDFAKIAASESEDPGSKGQGGDLGWFDPKDMVPEFAAALQTLQPGKISAPVRSQFGWHIILLEGRKTGAAPALDSVKPMIVNMLKSERAQAVVPNYYRQLVKTYKATFIDTTYREPELFGEPAKKDTATKK